MKKSYLPKIIYYFELSNILFLVMILAYFNDFGTNWARIGLAICIVPKVQALVSLFLEWSAAERGIPEFINNENEKWLYKKSVKRIISKESTIRSTLYGLFPDIFFLYVSIISVPILVIFISLFIFVKVFVLMPLSIKYLESILKILEEKWSDNPTIESVDNDKK